MSITSRCSAPEPCRHQPHLVFEAPPQAGGTASNPEHPRAGKRCDSSSSAELGLLARSRPPSHIFPIALNKQKHYPYSAYRYVLPQFPVRAIQTPILCFRGQEDDMVLTFTV